MKNIKLIDEFINETKSTDDLESGWGSDFEKLCSETSTKEQREIMRKIGLSAEEARKIHPTELKVELRAKFYKELNRRRHGYK